MTEWSVSFQHIIDNPLNVQRYNRPAAFVGFQEEAVIGVVVEEILRQGSGAEGILQDEEVAFPVWVPVGVVLPEFVPGSHSAAARYRQSASRSPAVWPREV